MAENKHPQQQPQHQQGGYQQGNRPDSPKPESASKPGKRSYEERERDRASQIDQSHQDNARGDRNPGNFQNDRDRFSEAGRKGGQR
jgi:general stress protein YciG